MRNAFYATTFALRLQITIGFVMRRCTQCWTRWSLEGEQFLNVVGDRGRGLRP
jgi:hypothetical protein